MRKVIIFAVAVASLVVFADPAEATKNRCDETTSSTTAPTTSTSTTTSTTTTTAPQPPAMQLDPVAFRGGKDWKNCGSTTTSTSTSTTTTSTTPETAGFENCDEARTAGVTPIGADHPGYAPHLDSDSDGIGCEWDPETDSYETSVVAVVAEPTYTG